MDDNGELISLLDTDIDRKLVLLEDISLYFALQQTKILDGNIAVDILTELPRGEMEFLAYGLIGNHIVPSL